MSKLIHYQEKYEWESDKEERSASLLPMANIQFIKNQLYFERHRKENLSLDPNNVMKFIQEEAEIKGAISAYQFLLDSHNNVISALDNQ